MVDLKKVIEGMEHCCSSVPRGYHCISSCHYGNKVTMECDYQNMLKDAIALLKEQEAREQCLKTKCVICPHCYHCDVDENGQLKEQEAVEPIDIIDEKYPVGDSNRYKGYRCGKCKEVIPWDANYCLYCGRKVKWE